jgi:hypothetical protein
MKQPMTGWILFASIMMVVVGTLDFFEGLVAIIRQHYFVVTPTQVIVFDMRTWGWITLIWGIAVALGGLALWSGSGAARWFVIILASLNILEALGWLGATSYPLWTLVIIGLNVVVVYALTTHWEGYRAQTVEQTA